MTTVIGKCKKRVTRAARDLKNFRYRHFDKFVFIHINKTGGSSIEKALHLPLQHRTALQKIEELGLTNWQRRYSFTVVRNPWDKVVSHYHYRVQTNQTRLLEQNIGFSEWVKLAYGNQDPIYYNHPKMFMQQVDWLTDRNGLLLVDFVCRFENLDNDFKIVCSKLGKRAALPHVKASNRRNYCDYYDKEAVEIVARWFSKDIEVFSYNY